MNHDNLRNPKENLLTQKAINYYEMKGLIEPKYHPESRYRDFSERDLQKLAIVAFIRQLNIPIDKIKAALNEKISMAELLEQHAMTLDYHFESLKNERELILSCAKHDTLKNIHEINTDQELSLK